MPSTSPATRPGGNAPAPAPTPTPTPGPSPTPTPAPSVSRTEMCDSNSFLTCPEGTTPKPNQERIPRTSGGSFVDDCCDSCIGLDNTPSNGYDTCRGLAGDFNGNGCSPACQRGMIQDQIGSDCCNWVKGQGFRGGR